MSIADRFERIRSVLEGAMRLEEEGLAAFMDDACSGDPDLRRDVEELLAERGSLPSILRTAGAESWAADLPDGVPPTVGPYRIVSLLGEGGMGAVYLARQEGAIQREVALKLIKPGLDTRAVIARFEAERQTLALLQHPNIAQVHDAGTTELGRPFFAMEYVPGVAITRFCDLERLGLRERLRLFVDVCGAIHHAHQRGVIHRDIKPSNVLVAVLDGAPVPKVIDFGIAKATENRESEATAFTVPGQVIGTPAYMSPEQADPGTRDIDITTDVYSLGALLYELLTGTPPFDDLAPEEGGDGERRRRIREDHPLRPSQRVGTAGAAGTAQRRGFTTSASLIRVLRGELDWITTRAMEKDRRRRYSSAAELRDEVERFLRGDPVMAGPPSATYRFGKLVRRHRAAFLGILGVFLAMAVGLGFSTTMYFRAEAAREDAARQARKAERVNDFLQSMLQSADPEVGSRDVTVIEVLARTSANLNEELAADPAVRAAAHATLGNTYDALGHYEDAVRHLEAAVTIHREILPSGHGELGTNLNDLGIALGHAGRYEEGEAVTREAFEIVRANVGVDDPQTSVARINLAILLKNLGRYAEAEPLYREALAVDRRVLGEHLQVANDLNNLAVLLRVQGKYDEAIELYREGLAMNRKLGGDEHHMSATILANLATALESAGRYDEAEPIFREVIELDRRMLGDEHPYVASDLNNLASLYQHQGDLERAEATAKEALGIRRRVLGPEHPSVAKTLMVIGSVRMEAGRAEEAEPAFREALEIRRERLPEGHPDRAWTQARLGDCLRETARFPEAEPLLIGAWDLARDSEDVPVARKRQILGYAISLYEEWQPERAAALREELARL